MNDKRDFSRICFSYFPPAFVNENYIQYFEKKGRKSYLGGINKVEVSLKFPVVSFVIFWGQGEG